jgi:hypothetical protein
MKFLLVSAVLLLSATQSLAQTLFEEVGNTWQSGNGRLESGVMVTWKTQDAKSGLIVLAYLVPSRKNLFIDGQPQWSAGAINCKTGDYNFAYIFDTKKPFTKEVTSKTMINLATDFCSAYANMFKSSPYYQPLTTSTIPLSQKIQQELNIAML